MTKKKYNPITISKLEDLEDFCVEVSLRGVKGTRKCIPLKDMHKVFGMSKTGFNSRIWNGRLPRPIYVSSADNSNRYYYVIEEVISIIECLERHHSKGNTYLWSIHDSIVIEEMHNKINSIRKKIGGFI